MTQSNQDLYKYSTLDEGVRKKIVAALQKAYNMELETVTNYLANAVYLDGMLAKEVKESLDGDVTEELGHARQLAMRIKILGGDIPGSQSLTMEQTSLQPPANTTDVVSVIKGVIEAETGAIEQYQKIIELTGDETDPVTQDLAVNLKGDEEEHRREFLGFLREYETLKEMLK
ncbi:MAG: ferritin-like domain-containing protein [Phycisphaeraceae bacterium]